MSSSALFVCRGGSASSEEADFDGMMHFIENPQGCRQAQVAGTFEGRALANNTALLLLCQGGCDVCDVRVGALRDMRSPAKNILGLLQAATGGLLARCDLLQRLQVRTLFDPTLQFALQQLVSPFFVVAQEHKGLRRCGGNVSINVPAVLACDVLLPATWPSHVQF
jgi:hypothetical protein